MVANLYADLARMLGRGGQEALLQHRVARPQQRQLTALLQQARQRLKHQVQPLLAGQTADNGKQRRFVIHLQPHGDLQLAFVFRFLFQPIAIVARGQQHDLSGAFRVNDGAFYEKYYGFTHQHPALLEQAVYGLAEWSVEKLKEANLIAVPGCYPTAAQLSLKPLINAGLLDLNQWPVINATSGVSGAGRKASIGNSFCEVSLQPYGVFNHRHHPEISTHLGADVIFTPHLGNFKRGILETITCRLKPGVSKEQVAAVFQQAYADKPLVRLYDKGVPALKNVVGLPFCDIGFAVQDEHIIVVAAEDNLLKGAAAQAVQCANIRFGFAETQSLI